MKFNEERISFCEERDLELADHSGTNPNLEAKIPSLDPRAVASRRVAAA